MTHQTAGQYKVLAQTAPILGKWLPHAHWATVAAVVVAAVAVAAGVAAR